MSKSIRNNGKEWSKTDVKQLEQLAEAHTPTRVIGVRLHRSPAAVYGKAAQEGIKLGTKKTARS